MLISHQRFNKELGERAKDAPFHDIRASSATDADEAGIDSMALLDHTTESSHKRYKRSKETVVVQPVPARKSWAVQRNS
jgi:hypothetical protein